MKKLMNSLIAVALIAVAAAVSGCGKSDDQNNGAVVAQPGYGYNGAIQYPPQNCVNGVCTCYNGLSYQNTGTNSYCNSNGGNWGGFNSGYNNPCYAYYGPYAQPTYVYGQLVCVVPSNYYNNSWSNKCQTYNYGTIWYQKCYL